MAAAAIAFLSVESLAGMCFAQCESPFRRAAETSACHDAAVPAVAASLGELPVCCHQIPGVDAAGVPVPRSTTSTLFQWMAHLPGLTRPSSADLIAWSDGSPRGVVAPPGPPQTSRVALRL